MRDLNVDYILNGSPKKRLMIAHDNLMKSFTESVSDQYLQMKVKEYADTYMTESLSFILENSRYIFSEPYIGYAFYEGVIKNTPYLYTQIAEEKVKLEKFIDENGPHMSKAQKAKYDQLLEIVTERYNDTVNGRFITEFTSQKNDTDYTEVITELTDAMYDNDSDNIKSIMESIDKNLYFLYVPYACESANDGSIVTDVLGVVKESVDEFTSESWDTFVSSKLVVDKLMADSVYAEAVKNIHHMDARMYMNVFVEESVEEDLNDIINESVSTEEVFYSTPTNAVNAIFESAFDDELTEKEDTEKFEMVTHAKNSYYGTITEMVTEEYMSCDDTSAEIRGYGNTFKQGTTIEGALKIVSETSMMDSAGKSASDDDSSEDDSDDDGDDHHPSGKKDKKKNDDVKDTGRDSTKHFKPKYPDLSTAIQVSAMDAEKDQMRKSGEKAKKFQKIKNAAKAVAAIPENIKNNIKTTLSTWDKADDERRAKFMIEPGFRKRIFRNLKLAISYGAAASCSLLMVPVIALCRHISKDKDRRIRKELAREIDTNIKITDMKIDDAAAAGDNKQKYELTRIKSQLEQEALRVKTNSKYV